MKVFNFIKFLFLDINLRIFSKKKSPGTVSLSDTSLDCYTVYVKYGKKNKLFLFYEYLPKTKKIKGKFYNDSKDMFDKKGQITLAQVNDLEVIHHIYGLRCTYQSLQSYSIKGFLGIHRFEAIFILPFKKFLFRFRNINIKSSEKLLKKIYELTLRHKTKSNNRLSAEYKFSDLQLAHDIFGAQWFYHPKKKESEARLKLLIQSLQGSGYLENSDRPWIHKLSPQGMKKVESIEQNEIHWVVVIYRFFFGLLKFIGAIVVIVAGLVQAGLIKLPTLLDYTSKFYNFIQF